MADNDKLCVFCQKIVSDIVPETFPHHKTLEDLRTSAIDGCSPCMLFWDHLKDYASRYTTAMQFDVRRSSPDSAWIGLSFKEMPGHSDTTRAGRNEILWYDHFTLEFCETVVTETPVPDNDTGGDQAWAVFKGWLDTCTTSHLKCPRNNPPPRMPTRCLDVGSISDSYVRVQLSDQITPPVAYTTLSHCWGKLTFTQLKTTNMMQMMNSIAIADLPKTFQDAITITRKLKVRYLWIDSLCIIQDSINDWTVESSMMGDLYKNSFCNIAATAAPDGRTGCFLKREPLLARQCKIRVSSATKNDRLKKGMYTIVPNDLWKRGMSGPRDAPLNSRAWVVQERVLAPCVLHFGKNQLFWECNELNACETQPNGIPDTCFVEYEPSKLKNFEPVEEVMRKRKGHYQRYKQPHPPVVVRTSNSSLDALRKWNTYVHMYSTCGLTEEDKHVAISAIAKEIRSRIDS